MHALRAWVRMPQLTQKNFAQRYPFLGPFLHINNATARSLLQSTSVYRVIEQGVVLSRAFAREELERFTCRAPGQANSYFCGYAKLVVLRKDTEAALGTKFNQKNFHDLILAKGLLPPDLMRQSSF